MRNLINLKALVIAGAIACSTFVSFPLTLASQRTDLEMRGRFDQTNWERYEDYVFELCKQAVLFGSLAGFLAAVLLPDKFADGLRRQIIKQAINDRLRDAKPLTDEELHGLHLFLEDIENSTNPGRSKLFSNL